MLILETNRLQLRHPIQDDLEALFALYRNPDISRYIPDAPQTVEETQEELDWFRNGHPRHPELGLWATVLKENGRFIGRCGLLPWTIDGQLEVEIAYLIDQAYWGLGLATEAAQAIRDYGFYQLNLSRLVSLIDAENTASIRVAEKIGMTFEREGHDEIGPFQLYTIERDERDT
ncbi:MAG: GNAT family N-acetyltransferase [Anaerolineae bacterium]|nr:GNAT family N-acetyltransferase [Anaerolineae bacterium]